LQHGQLCTVAAGGSRERLLVLLSPSTPLERLSIRTEYLSTLETTTHPDSQPVHGEPDCCARTATSDRTGHWCEFGDPKSFAAKWAFRRPLANSEKQRTSRTQPSFLTDTSQGYPLQRTHEYAQALSHIGQRSSHRIASKTGESTGAPIHAPKFFFGSWCRRLRARSRSRDLTGLNAVGVGGPEISQLNNIELLYFVNRSKTRNGVHAGSL